jgi:hypothetical protein
MSFGVHRGEMDHGAIDRRRPDYGNPNANTVFPDEMSTYCLPSSM